MNTVIFDNVYNNYMNEFAYLDYLNEKVYQENNLNNYINKIIESNKCTTTKAVQEVEALYEVKLSDSIRSKWNRFMDAMKAIYRKFIANLSKVLLSEKTYLKKYSGIILNKKGKNINFSYYGNYDKGIQRITATAVQPFDWDRMSNVLLDDGDEAAIKLMLTGTNFTYVNGESLATQLKQYFTGHEDGETRSNLSKFNFAKAYDYCLNFEKIKKRTDADMKVLENATRKIEEVIRKEIKNANADVEVKASTNDQQQPETPSATGKTEASFIMTEAEDDKNTSGDKETPTAGHTGLKITDVSKATKNYNGPNKPDENTINKNVDAAKDSNASTKDVTKAINKYISIAKSIITAKWTASEQIAKDYMKLIHTHVQSYGANKERVNDKVAPAPTDFNPDNPDNKNLDN